MSFKIEVIKPRKRIELTFSNIKNSAGRYLLDITDKIGRKSVISFDNVKSFAPSTLLSRWVNHHLKSELKLLAGKGSSYEMMLKGSKGDWSFRDKPTFFGLHDRLHSSGDVLDVKIDDSIGMKNVVAILNAMGYSVETEYDSSVNRMLKITLFKEL